MIIRGIYICQRLVPPDFSLNQNLTLHDQKLTLLFFAHREILTLLN